MYIVFTSTKKVNNSGPTLALKPRGDVTRNPKQGYQWSQKMNMCMPKTCVNKKQQKKTPSFTDNSSRLVSSPLSFIHFGGD